MRNEAHSIVQPTSWSPGSVTDEQLENELLLRTEATQSLITFTEYTFERTIALDATDSTDLKAAAAVLDGRALDILINNAGVKGPRGQGIRAGKSE
jgi:NAD(P)-dependent dehydrogenase (short-subunit alcohol dehydrogenase family)